MKFQALHPSSGRKIPDPGSASLFVFGAPIPKDGQRAFNVPVRARIDQRVDDLSVGRDHIGDALGE